MNRRGLVNEMRTAVVCSTNDSVASSGMRCCAFASCYGPVVSRLNPYYLKVPDAVDP